jgi:sulfite dehydrogenase (quinone) subunit SoeC
MRPAFSVIFLTTLIGAGQGLFLSVFLNGRGDPRFTTAGVAWSLALAALGLVASFFHLGRPERAWRTASMWRTSWLSREVILLPAFMALAAAYGMAHRMESPFSLPLGLLATLACLALFFCTAMIYACIRFLQEWASRYTLANFFLIGCASGATLSAALAASLAPALEAPLATQAVAWTLAALVVRFASLIRNDRIVHRSSLRSAIGIDHPDIRQISQGFTGESFNTLEFFHGAGPGTLRIVRIGFIVLGFGVPIALLVPGGRIHSPELCALAFAAQYAGIVMERWYFMAQASHPQNLYYQNRA